MLASLTILAGAILTITTTTTMHQPNEAYAQTFPPTIPQLYLQPSPRPVTVTTEFK